MTLSVYFISGVHAEPRIKLGTASCLTAERRAIPTGYAFFSLMGHHHDGSKNRSQCLFIHNICFTYTQSRPVKLVPISETFVSWRGTASWSHIRAYTSLYNSVNVLIYGEDPQCDGDTIQKLSPMPDFKICMMGMHVSAKSERLQKLVCWRQDIARFD